MDLDIWGELEEPVARCVCVGGGGAEPGCTSPQMQVLHL